MEGNTEGTNNVDFSVSLLSDCRRPRVDVLDNCCLEDGGPGHVMVTLHCVCTSHVIQPRVASAATAGIQLQYK